jgi:clan AA aspartic protease (TIGR02281 family)
VNDMMTIRGFWRGGKRWGLILPALWLLVAGCRSTTELASAPPPAATHALVVSTNPVPVEIEDDHVIVRGTVNGREVRLLLDTGATHVSVSSAIANEIDIQNRRKIKTSGFGGESGTAELAAARLVAVGPASAQNVAVAILSLPTIFQADGFLGMSFLDPFVFRVDYQRKQVTFATAIGPNLLATGTEIPLERRGPLLVVRAELDGIPAKFLLDSGAGQALILKSWFVKEQKLRQRYPRRLSVVTGGGILGQTRGEIVRLRSFKLGEFSLANINAEFNPPTVTRHDDIAGYIGGGLLCRFNLTFDLAGRRLWLELNDRYAMDLPVSAVVRSGLVCLPQGTDWIIQDLIPGSPADEANVRLGDRLLEIDGIPVQTLQFAEIKRPFRGPVGTRVRLRLQSPNELPRETTLVLRDLL